MLDLESRPLAEYPEGNAIACAVRSEEADLALGDNEGYALGGSYVRVVVIDHVLDGDYVSYELLAVSMIDGSPSYRWLELQLT